MGLLKKVINLHASDKSLSVPTSGEFFSVLRKIWKTDNMVKQNWVKLTLPIMLAFIIWISLFTQGFPVIPVCMVCLWIMAWAHTGPVSCQQSDCEGGQSLTTGSSDISPQTNNIFDQNHMMNIIHLIE